MLRKQGKIVLIEMNQGGNLNKNFVKTFIRPVGASLVGARK